MQRAPGSSRLPLAVGLFMGALAPASLAHAQAEAAPTEVPAPPPGAPPVGGATAAPAPGGTGGPPNIPPPPSHAGQPAPGGYGYGNYPAYPGPGYQSRYHGYPSAYPPPPPRGVYRPISLSFGAGPGTLIGPDGRDMALSYNLFRLGIGVVPNVSFVLGYEGSGTSSVNPATDDNSWLSQSIWSVGFQYHFLQRMYARVGMGLGSVREETELQTFSGGSGTSFLAAIGFEVVQGPHVSLGLEANGTTTKYSRESWHTTGLNLTLALY